MTGGADGGEGDAGRASVAGPAALIGTSAYPLSVDLGALLVSSAITVAVGAYLFERVEAV